MEDKPDKRAGTVLKTGCTERYGMQVLCLPRIQLAYLLVVNLF